MLKLSMLRKLELQEEGGYIGNIIDCYLQNCPSIDELSIDFRCSITTPVCHPFLW
ncbi:uncharacterized protein C8R40DRAFT_1094221 [Lentinula edodes]|uniref:uncharacterized protein n=1 Tax=Lentinula edodes TaxID=5353 RepID=UPI001E8E9968|nr:uncharacterized protein C8R40DRAFT_1094221 [Lentinula edodes]KAH7877532.1 hypothetical protein C8R40DRAFT_1094221 [Lentinula edodes]